MNSYEDFLKACDYIAEVWNGVACSVREMAEALQEIFEEVQSLAYTVRNTPPREYASRMKKNHLYREHHRNAYHAQIKTHKHQPYCRRIF